MRARLLTLLLFAFAAQTGAQAVQPAPQPQAKEQIDFITGFYQAYLSDPSRAQGAQGFIRSHRPFSKAVEALYETDWADCKKAGEEGSVCGFGADGDPFLSTQDVSDQLTFETSRFKAVSAGRNTVDATFSVFPDAPGSKHDEENDRRVRYVLVKEGRQWKIDDIFYEVDGRFPPEIAMRNQLTSEIMDLTGHPQPRPSSPKGPSKTSR